MTQQPVCKRTSTRLPDGRRDGKRGVQHKKTLPLYTSSHLPTFGDVAVERLKKVSVKLHDGQASEKSRQVTVYTALATR